MNENKILNTNSALGSPYFFVESNFFLLHATVHCIVFNKGNLGQNETINKIA